MSLLPKCLSVTLLVHTHNFDGGAMLRYPLFSLPLSRILTSFSYLDAGVKRPKTGRDPLLSLSMECIGYRP